jgi:hypothetical protein
MKKLLLSSIVLTAFAISLLLFQISCKKEANAQASANYTLPIASTTQLGGVMVDGKSILIDKDGKISSTPAVVDIKTLAVDGKTIVVDKDGKLSAIQVPTDYNEIIYLTSINSGDPGAEIWKVNLDGTGNQKINIALPSDLQIDGNYPGFSRTPTKIIFAAEYKAIKDGTFVYVCNLDGSGLKQILSSSSTNAFKL